MMTFQIQSSLVITFAMLLAGCSGSPSTSLGNAAGATGSGGGSEASGGTSNTGGTITLGGSGASGATNTTGGIVNTGGSKSSGGAAANGGSRASGGTSNTGGAITLGGSGTSGATNTTGGIVNTGGSKSSGGATASGGSSSSGGSSATCASGSNNYDQTILCDRPVAYWAMNKASGDEPDLTNNNHTGTHQGGTATLVTLPNADPASDFNGSNQYVTVASSAALSIPTTGNLTWEGWIKPDVLQFPHDDGSSGYVDWMGKCEQYGPTCEWEARMYDTNTSESPNRPNRISAYVFNPTAGLGSAADWQPAAGLIQAGQWYYVVGEYTTLSQPSDCSNSVSYPGSINVWVNGVPWNHSYHGQTGCMSQYNVVPTANASALNIGTMALDSWFQGAIGKVAIYNVLLSQGQITNHYQVMTGKQPTGSCADTCSF